MGSIVGVLADIVEVWLEREGNAIDWREGNAIDWRERSGEGKRDKGRRGEAKGG
jgi:hypothetical protein